MQSNYVCHKCNKVQEEGDIFFLTTIGDKTVHLCENCYAPEIEDSESDDNKSESSIVK